MVGVVGYVFRADVWCPTCVLGALPTGEGEDFDGWADCSVPPMSVEDNLDELASVFGFDRMDETTFDSDDFPKVVLTFDEAGECGGCGEELGRR